MTTIRSITTSIMAICLLALNFQLQAQCNTFTEAESQTAAQENHVLYRDAIKAKNFDAAFPYWEKAYAMAPAADGQRDVHFTDGVKIFLHKFKKETDEAKKKEYAEKIVSLYDQGIECLAAGTVKLPKTPSDRRIAYLRGRQGYTMFYDLRTPYIQTEKVLAEAVEKGGNNTEYIVLLPYATVVTYMYANEKMEAEKAREIYTKLNDIADHNIANNPSTKSYFESAKASMNKEFEKIEAFIFDCDYFVKKIRPAYEANPEDPAVLEESIRTLKKRGCENTEPLLIELEGKWAKYAAAENARREAEFKANNPSYIAKDLYDQGDYSGAIAKYKDAINAESDPEKQASYWFSVASIQFRKMKQYSTARSSALKAANLKSGWGRPYMLIGDMYASSARKCGDSWNQRLAILAAIDKYQYARSLDSEVASDASERISKYSASLPEKEEGFMRGVKNGQKAKVGCWIGESVTVRFK